MRKIMLFFVLIASLVVTVQPCHKKSFLWTIAEELEGLVHQINSHRVSYNQEADCLGLIESFYEACHDSCDECRVYFMREYDHVIHRIRHFFANAPYKMMR